MKTFIVYGIDGNVGYAGSHHRQILGVVQAKDKQSAFDYARKNIEGFTSGYDYNYWSADEYNDGAYLKEVDLLHANES